MRYFYKFSRIFLIVLLVAAQTRAYANPTGTIQEAGTGTVSTWGNTWTYTGTSDQAILSHASFSNAQNEAIIFNLPSSSSVVLNKVTGGSPSTLLGSIQSNGKVFLVNPNGITFGNMGSVDAAGLVASTLNITNADFLAGNYKFTSNGSNGMVLNEGRISTPGGYTALFSKYLLNTGTIEASLGTVALAAGNAVTLNLDPAGIVSVVVDAASTGVGSHKTAGIDNLGTLKANGGKVLLTAKTLNSAFDNAINNDGVIEATSIGLNKGKVVLLGDNNVSAGGEIDGGDVSITSTSGDVIHKVAGIVKTNGGSFQGNAAHDYIFKNGVNIDTAGGAYSVAFGNKLVNGDPNDTSTVGVFNWVYLGDSRTFRALQFGYYLVRDGIQVFVPLVTGTDIGKDGVSPLSGSGRVYADIFASDVGKVQLYTVFSGWIQVGGIWVNPSWTYYTEPKLNADFTTSGGFDHVLLKNGQYGWEDSVNGGDKDLNDFIIGFKYDRIMPDAPVVPPPALPTSNITGLEKYFPVYYQILSGNQLRSFEPSAPIGVYAYHPLTQPGGANINEGIDLSADAFNFIEEEMKKKK